MTPDQLKYASLIKIIEPYTKKGRTESASFLNWFLENLYRLDSTAADDCICDAPNDKGIDGVYADHNNEEIHFFQSKIRQKDNGAIGDADLKKFSGSLKQFVNPSDILAIVSGNANLFLKSLLQRLEVEELLKKGYRTVGIYVTNEIKDSDAELFLQFDENIRLYDRELIANSYIEADQGVGVEGDFEFDVSYVSPMKMETTDSHMYIFPAQALQLVHLSGISDTTLFTKNVRYDLGNTSVNKSIRKSVEAKEEHINFPLFHNGIIILCNAAEFDEKSNKLTISNYSVVNGAQSLTSFFRSKSKLTGDLRVIVRVIALKDKSLARKITEYSNNQNAIKPRDLRSNHALMTRIQKEMTDLRRGYFFEVKRGESAPPDTNVIENETSGRELLAFDLLEPWSCHQIYKIFDEKYSQIFGRMAVNAERIIFVHKLTQLIETKLDRVAHKPMAHYALTKYFLLYALSRVLRYFNSSEKVMRDPNSLQGSRLNEFFGRCSEILDNLIIDLNYESAERATDFDYKADLKSPKQCEEMGNSLLKSYQKDLARKKVVGFDDW